MMCFREQEDVAQPVEQLTFNERVVGSIPTVLTSFLAISVPPRYTEDCIRIQGYFFRKPNMAGKPRPLHELIPVCRNGKAYV